jgi:(2S)-methylsuccinyl-CoA dehydrogenase
MTLAACRARLEGVTRLLDRASEHLAARVTTTDGRIEAPRLDELQLPCYDLALCAAEVAAADAVLGYAAEFGLCESFAAQLAELFWFEAVSATLQRLQARPAAYGLSSGECAALHPANESVLEQAATAERLESIGAALLARDGELPPARLDDEHEAMRAAFAKFGAEVVRPRAQAIHRGDLDIPDEIVAGAAELGIFGVSIPQRYGGLQPDERPDTLAMLVVTEALSRESLGAAGSLITRPEIMARAVLEGGTDTQRSYWLPQLASGAKLSAISITEPDFGSDVAALKVRAVRVERGWRISGTKTWCTFAGRADVIFVVARTNPDPGAQHRGLSVLLVEKPRYPGHEFVWRSPLGGTMLGRAIRTLGYRGMHSFDLFFEDLVVPAEALLGGAAGEGRGFYLTMAGMTGGRLQTSARANGVMRAALDQAIAYGRGRKVFGRAVADYGLSRVRLARMAAWLIASQQFAYAVARRLDAGGDESEASLVKLFACRAAEWVTRDAMQMHGGMGYAEETVASRLFVDARVLSIFEGAEETLALKVIARELIARAVARAAQSAGRTPVQRNRSS